MCIPMLMAALGVGGAGAATAAGAVAGASTLATIGTAVSIGGSLLQGVMGMQASKAQAAHLENAERAQAVLSSIQEQRERSNMRSQIAKQRAELAGRGINLASPTAVFLGETAAREMSFQGQAIRAQGASKRQELSAQAVQARAMGTQSLLKGGLSAAGTFLNAAPDIWPGMLS